MEADKQSVPDSLEEKLAEIDRHLLDIRDDVSRILKAIQIELEDFRQREFWRDYRDTYNQE
jgi:hypothetical protein